MTTWRPKCQVGELKDWGYWSTVGRAKKTEQSGPFVEKQLSNTLLLFQTDKVRAKKNLRVE